MLHLRDEELAVLRSALDQAGLSTSPPPSSTAPPVGPESQEVPFSAPEPPLESAQELSPRPDPATAETVARLLRERKDLIREREEFCLQTERACAAKELLYSSLLELLGHSLHEAEFELAMERLVTVMSIQGQEQLTEACLWGEMDVTLVRLQSELDAVWREA